MKWIRNLGANLGAILALMAMMAVPVAAQPELPDPGMTPDSPFYFLDRVSDMFQSKEAVADEKAAEIVAMAQEGNERAMAKAEGRYQKAMENRQKEADGDENEAEEVARQASNHLSVLARVREQVPEQARAGIDRALTESANGRGNALAALERQNPERADEVAEATLQEVITDVPEAAQEGLQRKLEAARTGGSRAAGFVEAGRN
ncbi:MAG: DUF5667 domain-containing protein [Candidatus Woesearchaeota archaeon]